jgi:hypothetical protein
MLAAALAQARLGIALATARPRIGRALEAVGTERHDDFTYSAVFVGASMPSLPPHLPTALHLSPHRVPRSSGARQNWLPLETSSRLRTFRSSH